MAASILNRCIKTLGPASKVQTFQHNLVKFLGHSIYKCFFKLSYVRIFYILKMSGVCFFNSTYPGLGLINSREQFSFL